MSDAEVLLALAGALVTLWLSLLAAALVWAGRRTTARARHEVSILVRGLPLRTRSALLDGLGAAAALSWMLTAVLIAVPLLLILGPLLLAMAGLDLTAHIVKIRH